LYSEPRAAKEALGWTSTTNLAEDLEERYAEYASSGRGEKPMTFDLDDKILAVHRHCLIGSYYQPHKYIVGAFHAGKPFFFVDTLAFPSEARCEGKKTTFLNKK
jgi:hypothetical protein